MIEFLQATRSSTRSQGWGIVVSLLNEIYRFCLRDLTLRVRAVADTGSGQWWIIRISAVLAGTRSRFRALEVGEPFSSGRTDDEMF